MAGLQDLETLKVDELTPLSPDVISRQATINIGERSAVSRPALQDCDTGVARECALSHCVQAASGITFASKPRASGLCEIAHLSDCAHTCTLAASSHRTCSFALQTCPRSVNQRDHHLRAKERSYRRLPLQAPSVMWRMVSLQLSKPFLACTPFASKTSWSAISPSS